MALGNTADTTTYFAQSPSLTATWTRYRYVSTAPTSYSSAMLSLNLAAYAGDVHLGDVTVTTPA